MNLSSSPLLRRLTRLRDALVPEALGLGWMPLFLLGYLVFLFMPVLVPSGSDWGSNLQWRLWPTLASIAAFLPMYFLAYRGSAMTRVLCTLGIAALGCGLMAYNAFSNTYIIYAAAFVALLPGALWVRLAVLAALLGAYHGLSMWLGFPVFVPVLTAIISVAVFTGNYFQSETVRKRAELKLSHEEVRRLAALAERERIGRDLHDLLGHTLSMVALKSDLAGRLLDRDPAAARNEIGEVSRVAREALAQVRRAVSGIRAAGIAAELAAAKLLLETDGVSFDYRFDDGFSGSALPPGVESALAMTVREAATNIQRHARAQRAEASFGMEGGDAVLRIVDDGRGGSIVPGNGLCGMRERLEGVHGSLRIDAGNGRGTRVEARVPLAANDDPGDDEIGNDAT